MSIKTKNKNVNTKSFLEIAKKNPDYNVIIIIYAIKICENKKIYYKTRDQSNLTWNNKAHFSHIFYAFVL